MKHSMHKIINKIDSLLTRQRVIVYSRAILLTVILIFSIGSFTGQIDTGIFEKGDFRAFYTAGLIVINSVEGDSIDLYDLEKQKSVQQDYSLIEDNAIPTIFINPPLYAWLMVPFSKMSYSLALNVWRLINIMIAIFSVIIITKQLKLDFKWWDTFVILIASYSGVSVIFLAQNTFIFVGLYAVAYLLLKRDHDFSAGLILGLGALKPQLFIFLPIALLFQKKWNALSGFSLSVLLIMSASVLLIGLEGIVEYFNLFSTNLYLYGIHAQVHKMHSFPAFIRLTFGLDINAAYLALFTFLVIILVFGYLSLKRNYQMEASSLMSLAIVGSLITTPHLFHYDLALLLLPFLVVYARTKEHKLSYTQARDHRMALLALYIYLWLSHFTIDLIQVQFSVLLIIYLFAAILNKGIHAEMVKA